jgi:hypothetical protein
MASQLKIVDWLAALFFRTMSKNVWLDIAKKARADKYIVVNFKFKNDTSFYRGQIRFIEAFEREPIIGISNYICFDKDSKVIYRDDNNKEFIVRFSDIDKFELEYKKKKKVETTT